MKNGKVRFCYEIGDAPCRACDIGDTIEYFLDEDVAPTVNAVPVVHGWWVKEPDRYYHWHCSECGFVDGVHAMISEYCPKCGAKMEGGDGDETD